MRKMTKAFIAVALSGIMCASAVMPFIGTFIIQGVVSEASETTIGVDLNGSEGRANLKSPAFLDWQLGSYGTVTDAAFTVGDVTFKIPGTIQGAQNKTLMKNETKPYLTCDGLVVSGEITLEITGLSAGTHTLTTWHSYFGDQSSTSQLQVLVNNEVKATVTPTVKAVIDEVAAYGYSKFTVKEGETVVVTIKGSSYAVLNAFELDGAEPSLAITEPIPENNEGHHDPALGLSWTAAKGAVSHDVYLGDDENAVNKATKSSKEYKGNVTECSYKFTEELSHMKPYYWRIDEVDATGNAVKGKVMKFEVRHLAFPTAEGYGRFAKGGRGGRVIEVTTLEDNSEPGSLRYAIEVEKGARIIVFRVGGVIKLKSQLLIPNDGGNVYVAGQTAPGDGITLINYDFGGMGSEDVIIRNVRVRVGDSNGRSTGGMGLAGCNNCIIDHCSLSWATDEVFSSRGALNITFQNNIIAEALNDSVHFAGSADGSVEGRPEGVTVPHGYAASIGGKVGSFHHNLLINCAGRNWSLAGGLESDGSFAGYLDISNNVVYNWHNRTNDGGVRMLNLVNNYYKMGWQSRDMTIANMDGQTEAYVSGNMMVSKTGKVMLDSTEDGWKAGRIKHVGDEPIPELMKSEPLFPSYITLEDTRDAYETTLSRAGARVPALDCYDSRYIEETRNGTYTYKGSKTGYLGIIDSQNDVGGYPDETKFKGGEAPLDTDHDGMPDDWEKKHGLNPNDNSDNCTITLSAEGYTNVEMYLNELMGDPLVWASDEPTATPTPVPTATPTPTPTKMPTPAPTKTPTPVPTETVEPTKAPTPVPTETVEPTKAPTPVPTETVEPTKAPTPVPTETVEPTKVPTPVPTETVEPTETVTPKWYLMGDVNLDDKVTATDGLAVLKHVVKLETLEGTALALADMDANENIEAVDALEILKVVVKLSPETKVEISSKQE